MRKQMEEEMKRNQEEMEAMKKSWEERMKEQNEENAVSSTHNYLLIFLFCLFSLLLQWRSANCFEFYEILFSFAGVTLAQLVEYVSDSTFMQNIAEYLNTWLFPPNFNPME